MALGPNIIFDLILLRQRKLIGRRLRIIEIGAQQLSNLFLEADAELDELYGTFQRPRVDLGKATNGQALLADSAPSSRFFWESLGCSYSSIDYGGHRDSIALDLNSDHVPYAMREQFDLVVNAGTTEHIANQDNAFRAVHDLTAPNGVMLHYVPAGGDPTHGLFTYNMTFFWTLCRYNNYGVVNLAMQHTGFTKLPDNIDGSNKQFDKLGYHAKDAIAGLDIPVLTIAAALRRPGSVEYVTPLDVPAGVAAPAETILVARLPKKLWTAYGNLIPFIFLGNRILISIGLHRIPTRMRNIYFKLLYDLHLLSMRPTSSVDGIISQDKSKKIEA